MDIEKLYKRTVEIGSNHRLDEEYQQLIAGYAMGLLDMHKGYKTPKSDEIYESVWYLLEEMWNNTLALVEDDEYRRIFVLLCRKILQIHMMTMEGEDELEAVHIKPGQPIDRSHRIAVLFSDNTGMIL